MDVKIGITHVAREVTMESAQGAEDVLKAFSEALESEGILRLEDAKGRVLLIPAQRVGYIDCGQDSSRPVGFGSV